jgi:hypothetical protein
LFNAAMSFVFFSRPCRLLAKPTSRLDVHPMSGFLRHQCPPVAQHFDNVALIFAEAS